ncbi:MAG: cellulase family glycosylhydrolase [Thermoleophilaceae bacterium]
MRARSLTLLAAVLVLSAIAASLLSGGEDEPAAAELPTVLQDDAELLHRPPEQVAATLDTLRDLGVDWVRVTAGWSAIAPQPRSRRRPEFDATHPDAYPEGAWASLDRVVSMARERGMSVNLDIGFWAPRWAVSRASREPGRQRYGVDAAAYADFAEAVARRYPDVTAFTIWNEPNFKVFLMPQWRRADGDWMAASPHLYREMLEAAVPRVREHSGALVLIGALAALGSYEPDAEDDGVPPLRFVREMACVDADLQTLERPECEGFEQLPGDGFSHHPYSLGLAPWEPDPRPDNVRMADLSRLVDLLRRLHAAGRFRQSLPVFVTEYGYETDPPDPLQPTSTEQQARWLPAADRVASETDGVASFAQFLLRDLGPRDGDTARERWGDYQSGLRFPDGRPKPAERAFTLSLDARVAPGGVSFWVHVRDAAEPERVRIARREGDGFTPVGEPFETDAAGYAERVIAVDPGGEYRLERDVDGRWTAAPAIGVRR